jgi:hypothetical protein
VVRRNWFEHHEAAEIKALIDELHGGDAKAVRARLRTEYGFYVGDHVLDATRMTHGDFDDLVHRGRIRIVDGDAADGVNLLAADDLAFWSQEEGVIAITDDTRPGIELAHDPKGRHIDAAFFDEKVVANRGRHGGYRWYPSLAAARVAGADACPACL